MIERFAGYFSGKNYQARAFRGTAFVIGRLGGQNILRLASNLILTRLLFPEAFGLMALVTVVLGAAASFSDVGITASILQHERGKDPAFLNAAWTIQIARGAILCLAILVLAEPLAAFYDAPQLADLLMVSAFVPLIQGFNSTRMATARREIQLGRMIALQMGAQVAGILVMIVLALWLHSVWALVVGALVSPVIVAVLSHVVLHGTPNRLHYEREAFASLLGFGKYVFIATLAGFFVHQGDRAVLGKYISLDELAVFNIGMLLASVPRLLSDALSNAIVYPLYARRPPAESARNRRKINVARFLMTAVLILGLAVMAVIGDWLVELLYDARYQAAGPIVVVISLASLPLIVTISYQLMPLAYGHSGRYAVFIVIKAIMLMAVLLLTVPTYGVWASALAPGIVTILIYPVLVWSIWPYKGWDPVHDAIFLAVSAAVVMGVLWVHGDMLRTAMSGG